MVSIPALLLLLAFPQPRCTVAVMQSALTFFMWVWSFIAKLLPKKNVVTTPILHK